MILAMTKMSCDIDAMWDVGYPDVGCPQTEVWDAASEQWQYVVLGSAFVSRGRSSD